MPQPLPSRGRPRKADAERLDATVLARVSTREAEALYRVSGRKRRPLSTIIRELLVKFLQDESGF